MRADRTTLLVVLALGMLAVAPALGASGRGDAGEPSGEPSGAPGRAGLERDLQAILEAFLADDPVAPGVSARAVCPLVGLSWSGAAGRVRRDGDEPLTPAHTFRIASNTKPYTAAAVLRLVEQGRLGLDDPLARHLPREQRSLLAADGYDLDAMTLRQVLGHTSGLCDHSDGDAYAAAIIADPQHVWTADEQIRFCIEQCDPVGAPGETYRYSDTGYVILGEIVSRATGRLLGPAVRDLLGLDALGLPDTWWEDQEPRPATANPRAHQYYGDHDVTDWNPSIDLHGGGGLVSSAADLARFLRLLLEGHVFERPETLETMVQSGTPTYRLGLAAVELAGHSALGHQGFWNTFAFHVADLDLTVAGSIFSHEAANGRLLAEALVARVAAAAGSPPSTARRPEPTPGRPSSATPRSCSPPDRP
ncbi:MAG: serine hydrolase domain-containing protein [Candidatus Krumholzibacteriia bacterium]